VLDNSKSEDGAATSSHAGVAAAAFQATIAAVMAADNVDHWRCDTEDTEECDKITKLASRALQTLFLFSSVELGLDEEDVYTRAAWMKFCEELDWNECGLASCNIKFKTRNNAQGLGRERASPRPPKKVKVVAAPPATSVVATYLHTLHANGKLKNRSTKSRLQLRLTSSTDDAKFVQFVVSGATSMKKIGQLCTYLVGKSMNYEYHSQKGRNVAGSKFVLTRFAEHDQKKLWLTNKTTGKKAAKEGAEFVEDKAVKIVQVFQGLCTSGDSGIQYDSLDAKLMNETRGAVVFQLPSASSSSSSSVECTEYLLTAEGIFPNDCLCLDLQALPRLVTEGAFDVNAATPFGESLHMQNAFMLGDRKGPNFIVPRGTSQEHVQMMALRARSEALCNAHGRLLMGGFWNTSRVAKSSPP